MRGPRRRWVAAAPGPRGRHLPHASPTSTPSARASGTRSTPTARSPGPPACPTSSCTAPRRSPSRSPRRCGRARAAPRRRYARSAAASARWCACPRGSWCAVDASRADARGNRDPLRGARSTTAAALRDGADRAGRVDAREEPMTKLERVQAALKRAAHRSAALRLLAPFPRRGPQSGRRWPSPPCASTSATGRTSSRSRRPAATRWRTGAAWRATRSRPDGHRPCARHAVNAPEDWKKIRPGRAWSRRDGPAHLETILRCVVDRRADCSTMPTVFSPLSLARKLSGDRLNYDLKENPQAVTDALEAITETILAFAEACFREGAEGIFYSSRRPAPTSTPRRSTAASASRTTGAFSTRCGRSPSSPSCTATASDLMFDRLATLPAHAWNWDDRRRRAVAPRSRRQRARRGDRRARPVGGAPGRAPGAAQRRGAGRARPDRGRGLILGAGCVLPVGSVSDATVVSLVALLGERAEARLPPAAYHVPVAAAASPSRLLLAAVRPSRRRGGRRRGDPLVLSLAGRRQRAAPRCGARGDGPRAAGGNAGARRGRRAKLHPAIDYEPGCRVGVVLAAPELGRWTAYCHLTRTLV